MTPALEPVYSQWLKVYGPLYGDAATPELHAAQSGFLGSRSASAEAAGTRYQKQIGRRARHSLGEYFTPAWLADTVLDRLDYRGSGSLLDPSAGFGIFVERARARGGATVSGYELNPLTAACARSFGLPVEDRDTLSDPGDRRFDFIAGNPPWVNWRYLNPEYRDRIAHLWIEYGLLPRAGLTARLGAGMDDLSILFTCFCADRLLAPSGRMGLLLSRTLFQSVGGGRCFRRFELPGARYLRIAAVHQVEGNAPFPGAMTQSVIVIAETSKSPGVYPVPWFRDGERWDARPVGADPLSPWAVTRDRTLENLSGCSPYAARVGVHTGGATGVYWVDIVTAGPVSVTIRNRGNAGRTEWPTVTAEIEPDLVRTLVRGRDVSRWTVRPSAAILLPHSRDGRPVPEETMRESFPRTYAYFEHFRDRMLERPHYRAHFAKSRWPWWSMYNVGAYTFAPHRVVWREQCTRFECAVLEDESAVADAKLVVVPCNSAEEAHYVAAMLNSTPAGEFVRSYSLRVQMSTHVLRHLRVPRFDASDARHLQLAQLSRDSHAGEDRAGQIDELAAGVWELSMCS